jgi:hypothetical protein
MKNRFPIKAAAIAVCLSAALYAAFFYGSDTRVRDVEFSGPREETEASDNPEARLAYEFNLLKNPETGTIPDGVHELEMRQAREIQEWQGMLRPMSVNVYTYQGPDNMGGRTRAIAYDNRFDGSANQVIIAGGVSGGIFKSLDNGETWSRKSSLNELFSVTSIAQDPRPGFQDTWYYSSGEAIGNSAGLGSTALYMGNGIYKSTDNGETWTRLTNSNTSSIETFNARQDFISKVIVDPDGNVYFAATDGIYRSLDGGASWSNVLGSGGGSISTGMITDIVCTSTSPARFYASFSGTTNTSPTNVPGVWTSTTGASGSWTKIAGATAATSHANWDANGSYRRVVLALAPSDENLLFALYDNMETYPLAEAELFKWDQSSGSWTDLSANLPDEPGGSSGNDPFAVQSGYNLAIAVKPDDANTVFLGGTNLYRSTDGFTSTTNVKRIGGYAGPSSYSIYSNSHPDIHCMVFQPGDPETMLCGNDGGIQRTVDNLATTVAWDDLSNQFRTYQYYHVAIDPRSGNDKVLGGAQDNGTTRNIEETGTSFERVVSGDGVSVGLGKSISGNLYEYAGAQQGSIYRRNSTSAANFVTNIRPSAATDNGLFITLFKLDNDNTEFLYYASDSSLYRNTSASTANTANWTSMTGVSAGIVLGTSPKTQISAMTTSRGTYNAATSSLFIGTNRGRLYRLDDPANAAAATSPVNITGASFPSNGNVSSIAVNPRNDDTVLVTFSNYGVVSAFWTGNANAASPTWQAVEGSFTAPSFRSSVITLSNGTVEYFIGTSVGLYKATIDGASAATTTWTQEGASEIGNAVVSSLAYRPDDGRLLVGTHGYGMWVTTLSSAPLPLTLLDFSGEKTSNGNALTWKTSGEYETRNFEVERSLDGIGFIRIGSVAAANNSTTQTYRFVDPQVKEISYYRLKMNDIDGSFRYSNVVVLRNNNGMQQMRVLQNPVEGSLQLRFAKQSKRITIQLYQTSGALVASHQVSQTAEVNWPWSPSWSKGIYIIKVWADETLYTQKLLKK